MDADADMIGIDTGLVFELVQYVLPQLMLVDHRKPPCSVRGSYPRPKSARGALIQINEGPRLNNLIQINERSREGDIL
jgi:hypothetical protein